MASRHCLILFENIGPHSHMSTLAVPKGVPGSDVRVQKRDSRWSSIAQHLQDWRPAWACCAGAYHSLQRLRGSCDLVVVTSRQHCIRQPTLAWVQEHFPDVFREVHFGNHWALEGKSKAKSEICRLEPLQTCH